MGTIKRIDTYACRVPLDYPIRFKWKTIEHRDYTVVRVETTDGYVGSAIGLSRSSPIDMAIHDLVGTSVIGLDPIDVGKYQAELTKHTSFSYQYGILAAARSLVDIALWDIRGKVLRAPVWKLLGGNANPGKVLLVEGYELPDESDEAFAQRLASRVAEGYKMLKLEAAGYDNPQVLKRRLNLIRDYAGDEVDLVVDVNGSWGSVKEAVRTINLISDTNIAWVEDPFPQHRIMDVAQLRKAVDVPLGVGDDITSPPALIELLMMDAVDVLRVDATTIGGYSMAADVIGVARQIEIPVSTHAHPATHQHFNFAWPTVGHLEVFPDNLPFEPSYKLVKEPIYPRVKNGFLPTPQEPGVGLTLDMKMVADTQLRHQSMIK